jgi:hypothetical protein
MSQGPERARMTLMRHARKIVHVVRTGPPDRKVIIEVHRNGTWGGVSIGWVRRHHGEEGWMTLCLSTDPLFTSKDLAFVIETMPDETDEDVAEEVQG